MTNPKYIALSNLQVQQPGTETNDKVPQYAPINRQWCCPITPPNTIKSSLKRMQIVLV